MPTYDYECDACGHEFELFQSITEPVKRKCPKCGKPTRIVKRVKDRERGVPGGIYISCSACEFFEKL